MLRNYRVEDDWKIGSALELTSRKDWILVQFFPRGKTGPSPSPVESMTEDRIRRLTLQYHSLE